MLQVLPCQEKELSKGFGGEELHLVFSCCSQLQSLSFSAFHILSISCYGPPKKTDPLSKVELMEALSETSHS